MVTADADGARSVIAADLDGDFDLDMLSASSEDDKIAWHENVGGGDFSEQRVITTDADGAWSVFAADLDGDGDLDVLSASTEDDKIAWHENQGDGDFSAQRVITTEADGARSVVAADLDGDGDLDVLSASHLDGKIAWHENQGDGDFSEQRVITADALGAESVHAADLDGDGDPDVISASASEDGGSVAWHENLGGGEFSERRVIDADVRGAFSVHAADMDGDGDLDVLSASIDDGFGYGRVMWYENLGGGSFSWHVVLWQSNRFQSVHAADLDGDGDVDMLSASYFESHGFGRVMWHENLGGGTLWLNHVISPQGDGAWSAFAADLDRDGDYDVLSASSLDDEVAWHENLGERAFWESQALSGPHPYDASGAWSVHSADLDGDGDPDALSASAFDDKIAWYENLGNGYFSAQRAITTEAYGARSVYTADLDGDGDADVLWTADGWADEPAKVAWQENLGNGAFSEPRIITTDVDSPWSVFAADLDGDGDADVLSASWGDDDKLAWYENQGGGDFSEQRVISSDGDSVSVYAADLDGDGDADVLSALGLDNKIAWHENLGSGDFSEQRIITTEVNGAISVHAADLDGDGDMDVLSALLHGGEVVWYESPIGDFSDQRIIGTESLAPWSVHAADLDGDGDPDVLSASLYDSQIAWHENLGDGAFAGQRVIAKEASYARSVFAADLDGDGDADVLVAWDDDGRISWYENLGDGDFSERRDITGDAPGAFKVFAADLDGDGDPDVLSASSGDSKIAWYENLGGGDFSAQRVIDAQAFGAQSVHAADVDGDGDLDVLSAGTRIAWYENLGVGEFSEQRTISHASSATVHAADLDGDGDADVLASTRRGRTVMWFESLGGGAFSEPRVITTNADRVWSLYAADMDGDGDLDALSASTADDKIAWYENLGGGTFSGQRVITADADGAASVFAADLDGDGDLDVLSASYEDNKIAWYENRSDKPSGGAFSEQRVITAEASGAQSVFAADLDGDGDADVLSSSSSDNMIAWHENLGGGEFSERRVITSATYGASSVFAADLDGDNDLDVFFAANASNDTITWYENLDDGTFSEQRIISTGINGPVSSVHAADFDGDGDTDVLSASLGRIAWHENLGGGTFSVKRAITAEAALVRRARSVDFDNDGDADVVYAGTEIAWNENLGGGTFSVKRVIIAEAAHAQEVHAMDLDGDSDTDVLAAINNGRIVWYQNLGDGTFSERTISAEALYPQSVFAADLDGDGDPDVLSASYGDHKVAWYENLGGGGVFSEQRVITKDALGPKSVHAADLNGDGAPDVLSASDWDAKVAWYENRLQHPSTVPIAAPALVRVVAGARSLTVSWNSVPAFANGGSPVTGYVVVATPVDGGPERRCTAPADGGSCTITGLAPDLFVYQVRVRAENVVGAGPRSWAVAAKPVGSHRLVAENAGDAAGWSVAAGAGDAAAGAIIGAPFHTSSGRDAAGAVYLIGAPDLAAADNADELDDGKIGLGNAVSQDHSWKLVGESAGDAAGWSVAAASGHDGETTTRSYAAVGAPRSDGGAGAVYLVAAADLAAADAADDSADGVVGLGSATAQANSWKILGGAGDRFGASVASAGDVDGDGHSELLVHGAAERRGAGFGAAFVLSLDDADLAAADAADGDSDGVIESRRLAARANFWEFYGGNLGGRPGTALAAAGDADGDGRDDLLFGAPRGSDNGSAFLAVGADLPAGSNGAVDAEGLSARPASYRFVGEEAFDLAGSAVGGAGDTNGDDLADLLLGAPGHSSFVAGAAYLIASSSLAAADAADSDADGTIELGNVATQPGSWKLVGGKPFEGTGAGLSSAGDLDGDGAADLLVGADAGGAYLIAVADLPAMDAADGSEDGVVGLANAAAQRNSWRIAGRGQIIGRDFRLSPVGDADGDGALDLMLAAGGAVWLLAAADLPAVLANFDAADGNADGVVDFGILTERIGAPAGGGAVLGSVELYQGPLARTWNPRSGGGAVYAPPIIGRPAALVARVAHTASAAPQLSVHVYDADGDVLAVGLRRLLDAETSPPEWPGDRWETAYVLDLPGELHQAGNQARFEIGGNAGATIEFDGLDVPQFDIAFVPIRSANGEPSGIEPDAYMEPILDLLPVADHSARVGARLDYGNEEWSAREAAQQLLHRWNVEAADGELYHGVFAHPGDGSACGHAYLGGPVAVSAAPGGVCPADAAVRGVGSNFSLRPAPGCATADADPDFPHSFGGVGPRRGWLFGAGRFVGPEDGFSDFMSNCGPTFVSDYHYRKAATFRSARALGMDLPAQRDHPGAAPQRSLALTGGVDPFGEWSLDRVSVSAMPPRAARPDSTHGVALLDASGRELHSEPLVVHPHASGAGGVWTARVPVPDSRAHYVVVRSRDGQTLFKERINPSVETAGGALHDITPTSTGTETIRGGSADNGIAKAVFVGHRDANTGAGWPQTWPRAARDAQRPSGGETVSGAPIYFAAMNSTSAPIQGDSAGGGGTGAMFTGQRILSNEAYTAMSVHAADLDGDGDADALSASFHDDKIAWHENLGDGQFSEQRVITTAANGASSVHAADLDGDGDPDVLSASQADNKIAWYENLGAGEFAEQRVISAAAGGANSVFAADLDGDGDYDVLSASESDDKIAWHENLGNGQFSGQRTITTAADGAQSVIAADLDGDGDQDVLSASQWDDKIAWHENLGSGQFSDQRVITTDASFAQSVYALDLDGDGDQDVLSASQWDDKVAWHENLGDGEFSEQRIIATVTGASSVYAADLDGDGDGDVLSAARFVDRIAWHENLGGGEFHAPRIITSDANEVQSVYATDLDGDGDVDVLSASPHDFKIAWYENMGVGDFHAQRVISAGAIGARSVHTADLDGDGDPDVLSAFFRWGAGSSVAWYENLGDGHFSEQRVITTAADGASSVHAADLDGDGDPDVLSASQVDNKIAWYENLGAGAFAEQRVISAAAIGAISVHTGDLDGDGDPDVLSASIRDGKIAWYENRGGGEFSDQRVVMSQAYGARNVFVADLDGDGDSDVLYANSHNVAWHENRGAGDFSEQRVISAAAIGFGSVHTADLDGDGDPDVLSASVRDDEIAWYENRGAGDFSEKRIISTDAAGLYSVHAADLDGDGDPDVLSASIADNRIAWHENLGIEENTGWVRFSVHRTIGYADGAISVHAADFNGDGHIDVLSASLRDDKIAWYENRGETSGAGSFSGQRVITAEADYAESVFAADLDGDGDADVLTGSDKMAWHENLGGGAFSGQRVLTTPSGTVSSVHAADLDGDGDRDVLSASDAVGGDGQIAWHENLGDGAFSEERAIFASDGDFIGAYSVFAADFDGDGDADVLAGILNKVTWHENLGGGAFSAQRDIGAVDGGVWSVHATDFDGDGDIDALSASNDSIAWYENRSEGASWQRQAITTSENDGADSVYATDLDGDGDMDVLAAPYCCDGVRWYENLGDGEFSEHRVITDEAGDVLSVFAADLDGDGDPDVLSAAEWPDKIAWYENLGDGEFSEQQVITTAAAGAKAVHAADLDGDGDPDVLSASNAFEDGSGKIAWYENRIRALTAAPTAPTAAPGGVSVVAGARRLTISWNRLSASADGRSPITGYIAVAVPSGGGPAGRCTAQADGDSCTITGLAPDVFAYEVTVYAENEIGAGPMSGPVSATPTGSHRLVAEFAGDGAGWSAASGAGGDTIIGAPFHSPAGRDAAGAVYLVGAADLGAADDADVADDGRIGLGNAAGGEDSYKLVGESTGDAAGWSVAGATGHDGASTTQTYTAVGAPRAGGGAGAVYLVASADLADADAADGGEDGLVDLGRVAAQDNSWKIVGGTGDRFGASVGSAGDVDGDGRAELLVHGSAARRGFGHGAAFVLSLDDADLEDADEADGTIDGVIESRRLAARSNFWELYGASLGGRTGTALAALGDADGDGNDDLLLGAPRGTASGTAFLAAGGDLPDGADGAVDADDLAALPSSYGFLGEAPFDQAGAAVAGAGDASGDGRADLIVGAPGHSGRAGIAGGAAYLIASSSLTAADAADSDADGTVDLGNVAAQTDSWKFVGSNPFEGTGAGLSSAGDLDGDGVADLLVGADAGGAYLVAVADLSAMDAADGSEDGVIDLANAAAQENSWRIVGRGQIVGRDLRLSPVGDADGDGSPDLLLAAGGAVWLLTAADLPVVLANLDAADGAADGIVDFGVLAARIGAPRGGGAVLGSVELHQGPLARTWNPRSGGGTVHAPPILGRRAALVAHVAHTAQETPRLEAQVYDANGAMLADDLRTLLDPDTTPPEGAGDRWRTTYVLDLPGELHSAGNRLRFDIGGEPDGAPIEFDGMAVPRFDIAFVPISSPSGEPPPIDADAYMAPVLDLLPVADHRTRVDATLDLQGADWSAREAAFQLLHRWNAEAADGELYHGVFAHPGDGSTCGHAFRGGPVAVSAAPSDSCPAGATVRTVGANLSLRPAPGCGAAGADPGFPYPLGGIGPRRGWLFGAERFVGPDDGFADFMSNCGPAFVSDYHYRKAAEFLTARATTEGPPDRPASGRERSLALTGRVDTHGQWELNRVSAVRLPPRAPRTGAGHVVALLDAAGRELHREPLTVHAASGGGGGWAARVPLADPDRPRYIVVRDRDGRVLFEEPIDTAVEHGASR